MGSSQEEEKSAALGRAVEIRLVEAEIGGWGQGCHSNGSGWAGGLLSGVGGGGGGGGGDAGLSGSLAGRDTAPCDWGRARVSERGQE